MFGFFDVTWRLLKLTEALICIAVSTQAQAKAVAEAEARRRAEEEARKAAARAASVRPDAAAMRQARTCAPFFLLLFFGLAESLLKLFTLQI